MLPRINAQQRPVLPDHRILVGIRLDANLPCLCILHKPRPSTPLNTGQGRVHLLLELVHTAIALVDRLSKRTLWWGTTALRAGCKVLPEQGVVDVATGVEVDQWKEGVLSGDVVRGNGGGQLLGEVVVRGYVGVVVVFVVKLHDLAGDGGLEGSVVVW